MRTAKIVNIAEEDFDSTVFCQAVDPAGRPCTYRSRWLFTDDDQKTISVCRLHANAGERQGTLEVGAARQAPAVHGGGRQFRKAATTGRGKRTPMGILAKMGGVLKQAIGHVTGGAAPKKKGRKPKGDVFTRVMARPDKPGKGAGKGVIAGTFDIAPRGRKAPHDGVWHKGDGGCLVTGKHKYPCDDEYTNTKTGQRVSVRSTMAQHERMPHRVRSLRELAQLAGVKTPISTATHTRPGIGKHPEPKKSKAKAKSKKTAPKPKSKKAKASKGKPKSKSKKAKRKSDAAYAIDEFAPSHKPKYHLVGNFIRERLHDPANLKAMGFTSFKTKISGDHRVILAYPPGPRLRGAGITQSILHPSSEGAPGGKFTCRGGSCRRVVSEAR